MTDWLIGGRPMFLNYLISTRLQTKATGRQCLLTVFLCWPLRLQLIEYDRDNVIVVGCSDGVVRVSGKGVGSDYDGWGGPPLWV